MLPFRGVRRPLAGVRLLDLDRTATRNHGIVTRADTGLSPRHWRHAADRGLVDELFPGVARLPGTARTAEQRIAAAVRAAGPGAMASHRSAALLWGVQRPDDDPVDIIIPGRSRHPRLPGVEVHRPSDVARLVPQRRADIRCTNILRTLLDVGAVDRTATRAAMQHAIGQRWVGPAALTTALAEHARPGRAGIVAFRDALDECQLDCKPVDSILEPAMRRLAERHRLSPMEFHPTIEGWQVDFRVLDTVLIVECDGHTSHGLDRIQFERDRKRDDDLHGAGWIVLRFTFRSIQRQPRDTARRIRRAINRWSDRPPPDAS